MEQLSYIKRKSYKGFENHDSSEKRLKVIKYTVLLLIILIIIRLIQLQIFQHEFYNNLAMKQYNNLSIIPAARGKIYLENYKNGEKIPIATNRTLDMIYADPKVIENKKETAALLSPILEIEEEEIYDKINKNYKDHIKLIINPKLEVYLQIEKIDLPGIFVKTAYDYKIEEYKYRDEEELEKALNDLDEEEKEDLKNKVVEISANPIKIIDLKFTAKTLAKILEEYTEKDLLSILNKRELRYVPLKKKLSLEQSDQIEALNIYGIVLWAENWRFYPEKNLASHVLGFVDKEGNGQYGVEGQYNTLLQGKDGERKIDLDIKGNPIAVGEDQVISPVVDGANFTLTLDRSIQKYVEERLKKTVDMHRASSGTVLILNPQTGEIISLANYPTFNPNEFSKVYEKDLATDEYINKVGPKVFFNNAIAQAYEFGSTFKIITTAVALDSGEMNMNDEVCDNTGEVTIDDFVMKNADLKAHKCMTLTDVLVKSSNIGALRVSLKIGSGVFRKYITDFGFGEYTDIGFNDENNGYLGPVKEWGKVKTANAGFGQGITGSPLQLVRAVSAVANQGKLVQPYIIKEIEHKDEKEIISKREIRRVISPSTAAKEIQMLTSSVDIGLAAPAKVEGWSVAAKTGTAQVAERGGYSTEKYIASIIGFAPASNPHFVILVKIDYPQTSKFGSEVAAPLFQDLTEYILKYYEIPQDR